MRHHLRYCAHCNPFTVFCGFTANPRRAYLLNAQFHLLQVSGSFWFWFTLPYLRARAIAATLPHAVPVGLSLLFTTTALLPACLPAWFVRGMVHLLDVLTPVRCVHRFCLLLLAVSFLAFLHPDRSLPSLRGSAFRSPALRTHGTCRLPLRAPEPPFRLLGSDAGGFTALPATPRRAASLGYRRWTITLCLLDGTALPYYLARRAAHRTRAAAAAPACAHLPATCFFTAGPCLRACHAALPCACSMRLFWSCLPPGPHTTTCPPATTVHLPALNRFCVLPVSSGASALSYKHHTLHHLLPGYFPSLHSSATHTLI